MQPITGSGSHRAYYRLLLPDEQSLIGVVGTDPLENDAFWEMTLTFTAYNLPVPHVYARTEDHLRYLQEDLGTESLFDFLAPGRNNGGHYTPAHEQMLHRIMDDLPRLQMCGANEEVFAHCHPTRSMDEESVWYDLNYFKYCFLRLTGIEFHERHLQEDFRRLAGRLLSIDESLVRFQYRDFQARNVMIFGGHPHYIDYQGGRQGPIHYDVASFLWQAAAQYPPDLRERLLSTYLQSLARLIPFDPKAFRADLRHYVLFRTLQVLGAYGLRGLYERKAHFLASIPHALRQLRECLQQAPDYPTLANVAQALTQWQHS